MHIPPELFLENSPRTLTGSTPGSQGKFINESLFTKRAQWRNCAGQHGEINADWPIRIARSEGLGGLVRHEALPQLDQSTKVKMVSEKGRDKVQSWLFCGQDCK